MSRVGLIYFPDRARALAGIHHVLRPGGRVAAVTYSTPDRNGFFAVPVGIIRARAGLPAPVPGQPGPFSLGGPGVLEEALAAAGFTDVEVRTVPSPLRLGSAAECVRFQKESFGALHQMLAGPGAGRAGGRLGRGRGRPAPVRGTGRLRRSVRDAGGCRDPSVTERGRRRTGSAIRPRGRCREA